MTATDTSRAEWLTWRRSGIGASDIAALLGISPQTRKQTCAHCGAVDESAPFRVLRTTKEFSQ